MNKYPLWKNLLLLVVILTAVVYAMPNLYGDDPAVQISAGRQASVDTNLAEDVEQQLKDAGIQYKGLTLEDNRLLVRFTDAESQLQARELIADALADEDYIVALNLAPTTPPWLLNLGAEPMNLGLDLRGGVHFLMEVDMNAVQKQALTGIADDVRLLLREAVIRYTRVEIEDNALYLGFRDAGERDKALEQISTEYPEVNVVVDEAADKPTLQVTMTETALRETQTLALQQNITTLRNRINELGVAEPTVQQQGQSRIVVQLPGVQDTAQAKKILGATATLEFRLVDFQNDARDAVNGRVPANSELFYHRDGTPYLLNKRVMLTGEHVINAASTLDGQTGSPAVSVTLDGKGARIFTNITGDNIGNPMAVVFIESKSETQMVDGEEVRVRKQYPEIISVATIRDQLGKKFQITGLDSTTEVQLLGKSSFQGRFVELINCDSFVMRGRSEHISFRIPFDPTD